jgi:hypothetical protein
VIPSTERATAIEPNQLLAIVRQAFDTAYKPQPNTTGINRARSTRWVSAVANSFRDWYTPDPTVRVLFRGDASHRAEFGLNELLFDVLVCRLAHVRAPRANKQLPYITEALWQVESELARNGTEVLRDFSKLVLGSARQKLFACSFVSIDKNTLRALAAPASQCGGDVFLVQIPHPDQWSTHPPKRPALFRYNRGSWEEIN